LTIVEYFVILLAVIKEEILVRLKGSEIMENFKEVMKRAKKLYGDGKWKEARDLLYPFLEIELPAKETSKHRRLLGWCYYYIGKKNIENPKESGEWAVTCWEDVTDLNASKADVDSALAGLPLAYQYLLKDNQKAIELAEKRVEEASSDKSRRVALNSRGCIERDSGFTLKALEAFSQAYQVKEPDDDPRTVANVWNNRAITLMQIVPYLTSSKKAVIKEVEDLFHQAEYYYKLHEVKSEESAEFHLRGIKIKLRELEKL